MRAKRILIIIQIILNILAIVVLLSSCASQRIPCDPETIIIEKTKIVDTTIYVDLPREVIKEVLPPDSTSVIESSVAISTASLSNGYLHHSLVNKPQLPQPVEVESEVVEKEVIKTITEEVVLPLTWWQTLFIGLGKFALATIIALVIWLILRRKLK